MTPLERQQSRENARRACEWLEMRADADFSVREWEQVCCLVAEFKRLDEAEQRIIKRNQENAKNAGRPRSKKPSAFALAKRKSRAKAKEKKKAGRDGS